MREAEHLYSELSSIFRRGGAWADQAKLAFARLVRPVVGDIVTEDLFDHWMDKYGSETPDLDKLADIASFLVGEADDDSMALDADDWDAIRACISAEADEMELGALTRIMGDLVSRGALR